MRRVSILSSVRCLAGAVLMLATAAPAVADFKVFLPDAEPGEVEFESLGDYGLDPRSERSHEASFVQEFEYGVNSFWKTGIELEQDREAGSGQSVRFSQVTWENILQFTERGRYWLDAGFFFEFGKATLGATPNEVTFGPIFRKEIFGTINTVNLFVEKDVGTNAAGAPSFLYNWETRIALGTPIEPGFQAYGRPSGFEGFSSHWPQDNRIGPQLFGTILHLGPGDLKWNGGVLFGIRPWAPLATFRWQAEYEIHF